MDVEGINLGGQVLWQTCTNVVTASAGFSRWVVRLQQRRAGDVLLTGVLPLGNASFLSVIGSFPALCQQQAVPLSMAHWQPSLTMCGPYCACSLAGSGDMCQEGAAAVVLVA